MDVLHPGLHFGLHSLAVVLVVLVLVLDLEFDLLGELLQVAHHESLDDGVVELEQGVLVLVELVDLIRAQQRVSYI